MKTKVGMNRKGTHNWLRNKRRIWLHKLITLSKRAGRIIRTANFSK
jgi:hypothetical protein